MDPKIFGEVHLSMFQIWNNRPSYTQKPDVPNLEHIIFHHVHANIEICDIRCVCQ